MGKYEEISKEYDYVKEIFNGLKSAREFFKKEMAWVGFLKIINYESKKSMRNELLDTIQVLEAWVGNVENNFFNE